MRTLYLDCFAGIAGDMFIGAMADLKVFNQEDFISAMKGIALEGYEIDLSKGKRRGISGTDFKVISSRHEHHHRHLSDIMEILDKSRLPDPVKSASARAFRLLAEAEAFVHGTDVESIHFHEVGAVDSIADVIGAFLAVHMARIDSVRSSAVNVGSGTVQCAHGVMPVPAPATARLLEGIPVFSQGDPIERTTPTGALILKSLCESFGPIPSGTMVATGYGLGDTDTELSNVLRAVILEDGEPVRPWIPGEASVLETNVDDMNPQDFSMLVDLLFDGGAWDVFLTSVMMKKNRPGVRVTCVAPVDMEEKMARIILRHSTSIGVRCRKESRYTLRREEKTEMTSLGPVRLKKSYWGDALFQRTIEYDDLKDLSERHTIPLMELRDRITSELGGWSDDDR